MYKKHALHKQTLIPEIFSISLIYTIMGKT